MKSLVTIFLVVALMMADQAWFGGYYLDQVAYTVGSAIC